MKLCLRKSLVEDPQVLRIAQLSSLNRDEVLGKLLRLWTWADTYARQGVAPVTTTWLDEFLGAPGFAGALLSVGWLEARLHEIYLPNFQEYQRAPRRKRLARDDKVEAGRQKALKIPHQLDTPEFRVQWAKWIKHRKELGRPLTPTSVETQFASLVEMGHKRAIVAIRHSLSKNWQSIFEPRIPGERTENTQQQTQQEDELATKKRKQLEERQRARQEEERLRAEREAEKRQTDGSSNQEPQKEAG